MAHLRQHLEQLEQWLAKLAATGAPAESLLEASNAILRLEATIMNYERSNG